MSEDKKPVPMFVIEDDNTPIKWPVIVSLPVDGGKIADFQFTGHFKRLSDESMDGLLGVKEPEPIKPAEDGELVAGQMPEKTLKQILADNADRFPRIVVGWEGVTRPDGAAVEFSADALRAQILGKNGLFLSTGLWRAIAQIRSGVPSLGN